MLIDTKQMVSATEVNQNFSRVSKMVDESGTVIILKKNVPTYVLSKFKNDENDKYCYLSDSEALAALDMVMKENHESLKELAK